MSSGSISADNEKAGIFEPVERVLKLYNDIFIQIANAFYDFKDKILKPPNYEVEMIDVTNLKDCFDINPDTKSPCLLVNLVIKNNQNDGITFELKGRTIVTRDGKQFEKYGGLYNTRQLNSFCDTENFFKLFPGANKKVGVCFPIVRKNENPVIYIEIMANGKQKEHNFDLGPYISKS